MGRKPAVRIDAGRVHALRFRDSRFVAKTRATRMQCRRRRHPRRDRAPRSEIHLAHSHTSNGRLPAGRLPRRPPPPCSLDDEVGERGARRPVTCGTSESSSVEPAVCAVNSGTTLRMMPRPPRRRSADSRIRYLGSYSYASFHRPASNEPGAQTLGHTARSLPCARDISAGKRLPAIPALICALLSCSGARAQD